MQQAERRHAQKRGFKAYFVPIVITTALVYVAAYDAADINLGSGTLNTDQIFFGAGGCPRPEPWVQVQYGVGDTLTTEPVWEETYTVKPSELLQYKTRSIFVVNSGSLVEFLRRLRTDY